MHLPVKLKSLLVALIKTSQLDCKISPPDTLTTTPFKVEDVGGCGGFDELGADPVKAVWNSASIPLSYITTSIRFKVVGFVAKKLLIARPKASAT